MEAGVTFLQLLELRPSTETTAALPASSIPAASCFRLPGHATVAQMSCRLDAADFWKTSETTVSQTFNFVTSQGTW